MDEGMPDERRGSIARRRNSRTEETGTSAVPVKIGIAMYESGTADHWGSKDGTAPGSHLPQLQHYSLKVTWMVYLGTFTFSAVRQGMCTYLTAHGSASDSVLYMSSVQTASHFGITLSAAWCLATLLGRQNRDKMICIFTAAASLIYAATFSLDRRFAAVSMVIPASLYVGIELPFSQRRGFAAAMLCLVWIFQVVAQVWDRTYKRAASPYLLDAIVLVALVGAETMGVIGLLAVVDSTNNWGNAAKFCAATVVLETNSRSGVLVSLLYNTVGQRYRFSHAAHIFRWGKMWTSYCWVCALAGFAVPAIALKLEVKGSNLSFVRWETWALLGAYLVQQFLSDLIFIYVQHYLKPARTLDETRARCLVLGESAPVSGTPENGIEEDCQSTPLFGARVGVWENVQGKGANEIGEASIVHIVDEEYEPATLKLGPLTLSTPVLLMFMLFECATCIWSDAMQNGSFGSCGVAFSLPSSSSPAVAAGDCI